MDNREPIGSRFGFIMLASGCAIGLGNVRRFPYMAGAHGGADQKTGGPPAVTGGTHPPADREP
ncbi:MAG: hypothetical protein IJJ28_05070 [Lentisphaeria bacterium]|nr:hypothetical protein [Lentisphaeria bacterium]